MNEFRVRADAKHLRITILEFLIKFSEGGEVVLSLRSAGTADGQARVCFEVSDTGIGFDAGQADPLGRTISLQVNKRW